MINGPHCAAWAETKKVALKITRDLYDRGARGVTANNIDAALAELRKIESASDAMSLDELTDVPNTGPTDSDVLMWNA